MTEQDEKWTAEREESWLAQVEQQIGSEAMPDFRRMHTALMDLGNAMQNPPEFLGVNETALRNFIEMASHQVTSVVMSKGGGEERLIPMAVCAGLVLGAQLGKA